MRLVNVINMQRACELTDRSGPLGVLCGGLPRGKVREVCMQLLDLVVG